MLLTCSDFAISMSRVLMREDSSSPLTSEQFNACLGCCTEVRATAPKCDTPIYKGWKSLCVSLQGAHILLYLLNINYAVTWEYLKIRKGSYNTLTFAFSRALPCFFAHAGLRECWSGTSMCMCGRGSTKAMGSFGNGWVMCKGKLWRRQYGAYCLITLWSQQQHWMRCYRHDILINIICILYVLHDSVQNEGQGKQCNGNGGCCAMGGCEGTRAIGSSGNRWALQICKNSDISSRSRAGIRLKCFNLG
jgi:hypothetical protein